MSGHPLAHLSPYAEILKPVSRMARVYVENHSENKPVFKLFFTRKGKFFTAVARKKRPNEWPERLEDYGTADGDLSGASEWLNCFMTSVVSHDCGPTNLCVILPLASMMIVSGNEKT